jgi:aminopeptidase-like protein
MFAIGAAGSSCRSRRSSSLTDRARTGVDWNAVAAAAEVGSEIYELLVDLYPICRSISGDGVRATFELLQRVLPLELTEVPSGSTVFDWTVPPEWNIRDAWIADLEGKRVIDFRACNLHVVGYSVPVRLRLPLHELREHLHTHRTQPAWIPFRTSYYSEYWGFCLSQRQLEAMTDEEYEVCIDSTLAAGSITYAEAVVPGELEDEVLISTYSCHPSLANDNCSGIALLAVLGRYLSRMKLRYTYRLLFSPGSIGPLSWLAANEATLGRIRHGLVASCVGDPGQPTYKKSRRGVAEIDRAVAVVLRDRGGDHEIRDFVPLGGDERQFCSPGIDLPVGALSRTPADEFPEYHSSADNPEFVRAGFLGDSFELYLSVIDVLERNVRYENLNPKGEPQLGKRGLYRSIGGDSNREAALLWVLNLSDGHHDLIAIADRSGLPFHAVSVAADALEVAGLLRPI